MNTRDRNTKKARHNNAYYFKAEQSKAKQTDCCFPYMRASSSSCKCSTKSNFGAQRKKAKRYNERKSRLSESRRTQQKKTRCYYFCSIAIWSLLRIRAGMPWQRGAHGWRDAVGPVAQQADVPRHYAPPSNAEQPAQGSHVTTFPNNTQQMRVGFYNVGIQAAEVGAKR